MAALFSNYVSSSDNYVEPKWMREERYMYCEQKAPFNNAIWSLFKNLFL